MLKTVCAQYQVQKCSANHAVQSVVHPQHVILVPMPHIHVRHVRHLHRLCKEIMRPKQHILLLALKHLGCSFDTKLQISVMRPAFQSSAGLPLPYLHARGGLLYCRLPLLSCTSVGCTCAVRFCPSWLPASACCCGSRYSTLQGTQLVHICITAFTNVPQLCSSL